MTPLIINLGVLLLIFGWVLFGWVLCSSSSPSPPAKPPTPKSASRILDHVEKILLGKPRS
jgi:hypothetical protein